MQPQFALHCSIQVAGLKQQAAAQEALQKQVTDLTQQVADLQAMVVQLQAGSPMQPMQVRRGH